MGVSADPLSFTLRYRSQRREVWNWYWRRWRGGAWRQWLILGVFAGMAVLMMRWLDNPHRWPRGVDFAVAFLALIVALSLLALYPQLVFKPQERVLTAGPNGIDTAIGILKAHRAWSDIAAILDQGEVVVIAVARTGNAFVIPARAFPDTATRAAFLHAVKTWHEGAQLA
jgi:hypothetical protein